MALSLPRIFSGVDQMPYSLVPCLPMLPNPSIPWTRLRFCLGIILAITGVLRTSPVLAQNTAPLTGNAVIEGRVVIFATSEPVRGARVILNTDPVSDSPMVAISDDNGGFAFRAVPSGKYQLLATRDGYVRGLYGQRSVNGPGSSITVEAGQNLKSMTVGLTPMSAISGTIRNRLGEAVANVDVRALKTVYQDGRPTLVQIQVTRSNDLGDYRLYYLEPGKYFVSAIPQEGPIPVASDSGLVARLNVVPGSPFGSASGPNASVVTGANSYTNQGIVSPIETGETYVPSYFPGVSDLSQATSIDLRAGATFKGADFVVSEVRAVRIRGQLRDSTTGQPVKGTSVVLTPQASVPAVFDRYGRTTETGELEFRGIPPGAYDLIASTGALPTGISFAVPRGPGTVIIDKASSSSATTTGDTRLLARTPLRVGAADIENVTLNLQPPFRINGNVTFDGAVTIEQKAGLSIQLIPASALPQEDDSGAVLTRRIRSFSMPGSVAPNGAFTITGAFSGVYRIAIRGAAKLPSGAFVKSARLQGVDILGQRLILDAEPTGALEIVIGTNPGVLQAVVTDEQQTPSSAVTVVLVPDAPGRLRSELYFQRVTNSAGQVVFENIPPGNYQAYAWESVSEGAWLDADFLQKADGQGKPVRIEAGGMHSVELKSLR